MCVCVCWEIWRRAEPYNYTVGVMIIETIDTHTHTHWVTHTHTEHTGTFKVSNNTSHLPSLNRWSHSLKGIFKVSLLNHHETNRYGFSCFSIPGQQTLGPTARWEGRERQRHHFFQGINWCLSHQCSQISTSVDREGEEEGRGRG